MQICFSKEKYKGRWNHSTVSVAVGNDGTYPIRKVCVKGEIEDGKTMVDDPWLEEEYTFTIELSNDVTDLYLQDIIDIMNGILKIDYNANPVLFATTVIGNISQITCID